MWAKFKLYIMKLKQLLTKLQDKHPDELAEHDNIEVLYRIMPEMFPDESATYRWIEQVKAEKNRPTDVYTADYLPFHTRDVDWLAHYACQMVRDFEPGKSVRFATAKTVVKVNPTFGKLRNIYEQSLVKSQIKYMTSNIKPNGLMGGHWKRIVLDTDYDFDFHYGVMTAMQNLGIDRKVAEDSLEINAGLWRRSAMELAFNNGHRHKTTDIYNKDEHFDVWLPLREDKYYSVFRQAVDRVGSKTNGMKLTREQKKALETMNQDFEARYERGYLTYQQNMVKKIIADEVDNGKSL